MRLKQFAKNAALVLAAVWVALIYCSTAQAQVATTTTVSSSLNPSLAGQNVTFTVTVVADVGGDIPTGTINLFSGSDRFAIAALDAAGQAVFNRALPVGTNNITAQYQGAAPFQDSRSSILAQVVNIMPTLTTITSSLNPAFAGQDVTFTATATTTGGAPVSTGSLCFFQDGSFIAGSTPNALGQFSIVRNTLAQPQSSGARAMRALYAADGGCTLGTDATLTQTINLRPTSTELTSSVNPSAPGAGVTFTATVSNISSAAGAPNDGVSLSIDGAFVASAPLSGGSVNFGPFTALASGNRIITAIYQGSTIFQTSNAAPLTQVVAVPALPATTTTVSSAPNPSMLGQSVTLTANVTSISGTPTGSVEFFDDGTSVGISSLAAGSATLSTTALAAGPNAVIAVYAGSTAFAASTSAAQTHTVNGLTTTTTIASSLNPSQLGDNVMFTALVETTLGTPAGTVEFRQGTIVLGTGVLAGGTATFATTALPVGIQPISAHYLGANNFPASQSAPLNQVVNAVSPTNFSDQIDDIQETATGVAARMASENITDSVAEEISGALSGQVQVMQAAGGKITLAYGPEVIKPGQEATANLAAGQTDKATWRVWSSLRFNDFDSSKLEGDQVNALIGTTFVFQNGLVAGLVAGYENQDYKDEVNATRKGKGFNIGGYAGGQFASGLRYDAQLHASFLNYDMAAGPVTASTDATRVIVSGGIAHTFRLGDTTFEPTARLNGTWEMQQAYVDSAAVAHAARDFNFGRIATGAKITHRFDLGEGTTLSPFVEGFADYRFSGGDTTKNNLLDGLSARLSFGAQLTTSGGITASALAEFSGLGLSDDVLVQSYKAQLAIPF